MKAVAVEQGEPSIALLLLWETDHGKPYPSQAVELVGRMSTFTKRLQDAAAADHALSHWLIPKKVRMQLPIGLPSGVCLRWPVHIDSAVGEPFLRVTC